MRGFRIGVVGLLTLGLLGCGGGGGGGSKKKRPPPSLTVISPNGGESFLLGDTATVSWSSRGKVSDVSISLSTDGGTGWSTVVATTSDDGEEAVTLPLTATVEALFRVAAVDGDPADDSDAVFNLETATPADSPAAPARGYFLGVLPSTGGTQDFEDAHVQAALHADWFPVWGRPTPFWEKAEDFAGAWGDTFIEDYGRGNGMLPLVHFSFIAAGHTLSTPPGMAGATLDHPDWRDMYRGAVLDVVRTVRPLYLSVGNEVNRWYEAHGADPLDPDGFQHFVSLYEEIYDEVKIVSPETQVFCVFAREIVAENREADLASVFAMFDPAKLDVVAFTSYPFSLAGINVPDDVPDD
jgi:hypothetical protein